MMEEMQVKERKRHPRVRTVLFILFLFIAIWLMASAHWAFTTWSNLEMSEIIYQLTAPLTGTGNNMISEYIGKCVVPAVIAAAACGLFLFLIRKKYYYTFLTGIGMIVSLFIAGGTGIYAYNELDVGTYLENRGKDSTYIEENYADPSKVKLTFPEKKRNLIYIYLESMETTYADTKSGGGMPENYIPELTKLAQENEDFSGSSDKLNGGYSMTGTTWTVGAMFAQTSGLPLQIPLDTNGMSSQAVFFPGITTLGDILEQQNYNQTLLIGSDATFGGRRLYFSQHGNYDMLDYNYAQLTGLIPQGYKVWWGYEDARLFEIAKARLSDIAYRDTPFNLTMLTVDTHFPDGYVCDECGDEFGDNQYANVMHCSSKQVDAFVIWCKQQPWYDNTTIVISGDHPTMDADFCDDVSSDYTRKVYTTYINAAARNEQPKVRRKYATFDNFPTTLAAMGVEIEGDRLGLGTNLFSKTETLSERDGYASENIEMMRNSKFMMEASQISSDVVEMRQKLRNTKVKVTVEVKGEYLQFSVKGLDQIKDSFRSAFIHCRNSNQLTLTQPLLQEMEDGTYAIRVPKANFKDYTEITYMLRLRTTDGTVDMTDAIPYTIEWK